VDVRDGVEELEGVGFGVMDLEDIEDAGVVDVARELVGLGGADATLLVVTGGLREEFIFQAGRAGAFNVVAPGTLGVKTGFPGGLAVELRSTVPFGGGGGGRVGGGTDAERVDPN
jgi:hypothetical protein